jgi:hypothetical protein
MGSLTAREPPLGLFIKGQNNMKSGIIYSWWSSSLKSFDITGSEPDEDIRATPRQGCGVREIAAWLSDDVNSQNSAHMWIERVNAVAEGTAKGGYLGTGNAHHVRAVGEQVFLECEFAEELKVFMTRAQIVSTLQHYIQFLNSERKNKDYPPNPFEVEYEAEGEEALDRYLATGGALGWTEEEIAENTRKVNLHRKSKR